MNGTGRTERIWQRYLRFGCYALLPILILSPLLALLWMTAVPGRSYDGSLPPLTPDQAHIADQLQRHVATIARKPHNAAHSREMAVVAAYIEAQLRQMGYEPRRQPIPGAPGMVNIDATLDPADPRAPMLVIGAHYDSYGATAGANDNGSGTAATLELARALADLRGKARLRLRFVLFANEEPPFFQTDRMGSMVYARALANSGASVLGMISLETLGYYSDRPGSQHYPFPLSLLYPDTGDFVAFVGMAQSRSFVRSTVGAFRDVARFPSVGGSAPAFVHGIDWSDHWAFAQIGAPALMVTDTAPFRYRYYHSEADRPGRLDYPRLARVVDGLEQVVRKWALAGRL